MKGIFIPDITAEMFRNGCLEGIEALLAEGKIYDIDYSPWIPVSEKVPEEFDEVLCCTDSDEIFIAKYLGKMNDGTDCFDDDDGMMQEGDLIAWMPLPEPYKADSEGRRMTEIVKKLKAIAQDQNISQRELAKRMNNTETSVSRWFKGSRIPNAKNLEQMAAALGYRLTIEEDGK